ncbi:hypothetical protein B7Y94_03020, partial [Candidatus Saccharibacteria bacterium 32-49-12]
MPVRYATANEIARWDELILSRPDGGNIFSSKTYAEQKVEQGHYQVRYIMVDNQPVTVLEKHPFGFGRYWYLPKGPNVTTVKDFDNILSQLRPFAKANRVFVIRAETELDRTNLDTLKQLGYQPSRAIIPNPSTITLTLESDIDEIMMGLPQKGRHAIRRAERDGVVAEPVAATDENCQIMYDLLSATAEGQFGIRPFEYYRSFWQRFESAGLGQLFFAKVDNQVVAGAYAMIYGTKSTYKDGASVRNRPAYGSSHLLQWRVIEWAKNRGSVWHDFCGAPPSDQINNPDHPHY